MLEASSMTARVLMFIRFVAALFLGLAAFPAWAQEGMAARRAVAAEYLELQLDAVVPQVARAVLAPIKQRQPRLYAQKAERLNELVLASLAQSMRNGMIGVDDDMARVFSLEELRASRDFYDTPVGRSVMTKMPAFLAEMLPRLLQQSVTVTEKLKQDLRAEGVRVQ